MRDFVLYPQDKRCKSFFYCRNDGSEIVYEGVGVSQETGKRKLFALANNSMGFFAKRYFAEMADKYKFVTHKCSTQNAFPIPEGTESVIISLPLWSYSEQFVKISFEETKSGILRMSCEDMGMAPVGALALRKEFEGQEVMFPAGRNPTHPLFREMTQEDFLELDRNHQLPPYRGYEHDDGGREL